MIILTGQSASGKTTIANDLIKRFGYQKFITHTTRAPRIGEVNHVDYHFVSREEFLEKKKNGKFIETMEYNGNLYGSSIDDIGDNKVLIVDINGANHFSEHVSNDSVFFFIVCDDKITKKRMIERGDKQVDIEKRLKSDKILFDKSLMKRINYVIDTTNIPSENVTEEVLRLYNDYINSHNNLNKGE